MTSKDYVRCDNCDKPISFGPKGWVHEDSDQMMCERAEPKTEGIRRWLEAEKKQWDDAASKLPSAPSPAGETASEGNKPCFNCGCESIGKSLKGKGVPLCRTHFDMAIVAGWEPQLYAELGAAVPEPVPTEGAAGTVNTPVGPLIPKSAPEAAAAPSTDELCDRSWIAGARWGWDKGIAEDREGFNRAIEQGQKLIQEAKAERPIAAPIAPAAEELIADALERARSLAAEYLTIPGADNGPTVWRTYATAIMDALDRAEEYRKGAKNG